MNRLAVYCGSASPQDPRFIQLAYDVGKGLAQRGIGVVYGGGRLGLMGATARGALEAGGEVIGVIPDALANSEVANHDCTELYTVGGMHERKQRFTDLSDGFITIPGGVGTMAQDRRLIGQNDFSLIDFGALQHAQAVYLIHRQLGKQRKEAADIGILGVAPELPEMEWRQFFGIQPDRTIG